jgi:hypothetical protein
MLEAELRAAVESGNVDAAVDKWVAAGSSLKILLYLIKLFQQHEHVPSSLPHVLKSLHAADPNTNGQANRTSGSNQQVYGARFRTGFCTLGCHWIPRMFA